MIVVSVASVYPIDRHRHILRNWSACNINKILIESIGRVLSQYNQHDDCEELEEEGVNYINIYDGDWWCSVINSLWPLDCDRSLCDGCIIYCGNMCTCNIIGMSCSVCGISHGRKTDRPTGQQKKMNTDGGDLWVIPVFRMQLCTNDQLNCLTNVSIE